MGVLCLRGWRQNEGLDAATPLRTGGPHEHPQSGKPNKSPQCRGPGSVQQRRAQAVAQARFSMPGRASALPPRPPRGQPGCRTAPRDAEPIGSPPTGATSSLSPAAPAKITAFGRDRRHEETWSRTPNTTGAGAIHVKSFHCKLTEDALAYMDQTINEWLDAHAQYEVKFVNSAIGTMTGKLKEPALICQVWV